MRFLKSFLRGLLSVIFKLSLVLLIVLAPLVTVFGTAVQLKQSLRDSKIYDGAVSGLVENVKKDLSKDRDPNKKEDAFPLNNAAVEDALRKAVTPAFLQSSSEQIIDGIYGWLDGKTAQPEFNIDISGVKQNFTNAIGDYAVNRGKTLPACTVGQARQAVADGKVDPLTTPCLPAGYSLEDLRAEITKQLNTPKPGEKDNLLQQNSLTPDTLPKGEDGRNPVQKLTEDASNAPKIFRLITLLPFLLGGLAIAAGGLTVLLYDDKRRGVRDLAWTLLPLGALSLLGIFAANMAFARLEKSDSLVNADANIREPLLALIHSLSSALNQKILLLAGAYVLLGAGTLIVLHFTKPDTPEKVAHNPSPELPEPVKESDQKLAEAAVDKPKKPKKTLIQ